MYEIIAKILASWTISNLQVQIKTTRKSLRVAKKVSFEPWRRKSPLGFLYFHYT